MSGVARRSVRVDLTRFLTCQCCKCCTDSSVEWPRRTNTASCGPCSPSMSLAVNPGDHCRSDGELPTGFLISSRSRSCLDDLTPGVAFSSHPNTSVRPVCLIPIAVILPQGNGKISSACGIQSTGLHGSRGASVHGESRRPPLPEGSALSFRWLLWAPLFQYR